MKPRRHSAANQTSQMMKKCIPFGLLVTLLSGSAVQAMPAPQPDHFGAGGMPQDRRCTINVSSQDVDFGTLSRWQMQETGRGNTVSPGQRTLALSVSCPYSQPLHIMVQGEPAGDGNLRYGHAGSLQLDIHDAQVDGQPVQLIPVSRDRIRKGGEQAGLRLGPGSGVAASRNGSLVSGKTFTARLEVRPQLPERETRVTARQQSETRLTLEILP